jgi:uncharacterized protein
MSRHQIDYESLAQDAMRGLVRTVLLQVAKNGLPGDHHFYISFHTRGADVSVSKRLLERYPDEMTIVLQNKFSDLKAFDDRFEVTLWFDSIPERLLIPYTSIKVFFDPSVPYGHQFEAAEAQTGAPAQVPAARTQTERRGDDRPTPVTSMTSSPSPRSRQGGQGGKPDATKPGIAPASKAPTPLPAKAAPPSAIPSIGVQGGGVQGGGKQGTGASGEAKSDTAKAPVRATPETDRKPPARPIDAPSGPPTSKDAAPPMPRDGDGTATEAPSKVVALDAFRKKS